MKAVQWLGPRKMALAEVPKPSPKPHEALIRIESVGVCGSDIHYYAEGRIGDQLVKPPLILGHEYAGIVEAVGDAADPSLVGKRVAVEPGIPCGECEWCEIGMYNVCEKMFFPGGPGSDGALSEYYTVNADYCHPVPPTMSAAHAAMVEPLAVAVHAVELAQLHGHETVAIIGLGPIGLLAAQVLKANDIEVIYGADLLQYRVECSPEHGVTHAINAQNNDSIAAIREATNGRGVDVAFDCSNTAEGLNVTCRVTRPAGRCILTGISGNDMDPLPVSVCRRRELTLIWCRRFRDNFHEALSLMEYGKVDIEPLLTHTFSLEDSPAAYELVANYADNVLKASIDF